MKKNDNKVINWIYGDDTHLFAAVSEVDLNINNITEFTKNNSDIGGMYINMEVIPWWKRKRISLNY